MCINDVVQFWCDIWDENILVVIYKWSFFSNWMNISAGQQEDFLGKQENQNIPVEISLVLQSPQTRLNHGRFVISHYDCIWKYSNSFCDKYRKTNILEQKRIAFSRVVSLLHSENLYFLINSKKSLFLSAYQVITPDDIIFTVYWQKDPNVRIKLLCSLNCRLTMLCIFHVS